MQACGRELIGMRLTGANGLAKFFLVDQSLTGDGNHHADYMRLIAQAAANMGYTPFIGANTAYSSQRGLLADVPISAGFRGTTYSKHSILSGVRETVRAKPIDFSPAPRGLRGIGQRLRRHVQYRLRSRKRQKHIYRFAQDCENFFREHSFSEDDHAFFITMSELDFMGLAAFLSNHPRTLVLNWHVQFHFSPLVGRPHQYANQANLEKAISNCFRTTFTHIPYHHVRCYTTTDELARQYTRLGAGCFESLPYPIEPQLKTETPDSDWAEPLKLTIAGSVRREKGQKSHVGQLIRDLWDDHLATEQVQLHIQSATSHWLSPQQTMRGHDRVADLNESYQRAVVVHPHPLSEADYVQLIQTSDAGLFFYDGLRYYGRRAGILGEFLAAGKPVIVPAGSWLSEQIAAPTYRYLERLITDHSCKASVPISETKWSSKNAPLPGGIISFDKAKHPFEFSFQPQPEQSTFVIRFAWNWSTETSEHVQIDTRCLDDAAHVLEEDSQIISLPQTDLHGYALFNCPPGTKNVEVSFRNAYDPSSLVLADVTLFLLEPENGVPLPTSSVGIPVTTLDQMASAIDKLVAHYQHYRKTADEFSRTWAAKHDPYETLVCLTRPPIQTQRAA